MDSPGPFDYTVKVANNSRGIQLQLSLQKGLEVRIPRGVSRKMVNRVLKKNQEWIVSSLGQIRERLERLAPEDIELQASGRRWEVEYRATSSGGIAVEETRGATLLVNGNIGDSYKIALALRRWLGGRAQKDLVPWLRVVSEELDLPFGKVLVKGQRTRWGSCSPHKTISINRNLLFLPAPLVRYVLIQGGKHMQNLVAELAGPDRVTYRNMVELGIKGIDSRPKLAHPPPLKLRSKTWTARAPSTTPLK